MNITENAFEPLHALIPHVVLYTKNDCHTCTVMKSHMKSRNIPFIAVNMETYEGGDEILDNIKKRIGVASAPITVVHNIFLNPAGDSATTFWAGFAPDQTKALLNTWHETEYAPYAEQIEAELHDDPTRWATKAEELVANPNDMSTKHRPLYKMTSNGSMQSVAII